MFIVLILIHEFGHFISAKLFKIKVNEFAVDKFLKEEIPYLARITAVGDTYDAMTSRRPYRNALPLDVVKAEIKKCAGTQFDPAIANVFLDLLENDYDKIQKIENSYY